MKKGLTILLVLSMLLMLAACGGTASSAPAAEPSSAAGASTAPAPASEASAPQQEDASEAGSALPEDLSQMRIGILHPGSLADGGYNMLAKNAGDAIKEKWDCTVDFVQAPTSDKMKSEAETLANEGYHIIIGHGGEYNAPFAEICESYPEVYFLTNGGAEVRDNLYPINMCSEQGSYIGGVVAGLMTETDKIGWTVGSDSPGFSKTGYTFELGAKSVNPDVTAMSAVLTSIDANEAYETTLSQINWGADFIFSSTDEAQLGALKAVLESPDTRMMGMLQDLSADGGEQVFASTTVDFALSYIAGIQACIDGVDEPDVIWIGLDSGGVQFVWNEAAKANLPAEVVEQAEAAIQGIIDGEIDVPNEYEYAEIRNNS